MHTNYEHHLSIKCFAVAKKLQMLPVQKFFSLIIRLRFFWLCRSILHVCECRNWTSYSFDFYNLLLLYGNSVFTQYIEMFTIHTRFPPQTKKECTLFVVDIIVIFDSLYLNLSDNQILVYNRLQRYTLHIHRKSIFFRAFEVKFVL